MHSLLVLASAALALAAPSKRSKDWQPSGNWQPWGGCNANNARTRVSFSSMPADERKAYVDAIYCIHNQPSQLDQSKYPAAINKYQDYAVVHTERTDIVHLDGYFLTWHRQFLALFEEDLRQTCGYTGRFPYWDFSNDLEDSVVFNGSPSSLGSNGVYNNTGPIALGPQLVIPHGTGGGCLIEGPFSDWTATLAFIDPLYLLTGKPLPDNTYNYNASCLRRDLNSYVAHKWTGEAQVVNTSHSESAQALEYNVNGIIGGAQLGVHSAAHFIIGGQMGSIHVSVQDPIWWSLHANLDRIYSSWQKNNPEAAYEVYGTMTAANVPPSANVTVDDVEPDWGYFKTDPTQVKELQSTMGGPFCYQYDEYIS